MQKSALVVACLIFSFVAIAHFARVYFALDFVVGGVNVSLQVSLIAGLFTAALAMWMYWASRRQA